MPSNDGSDCEFVREDRVRFRQHNAVIAAGTVEHNCLLQVCNSVQVCAAREPHFVSTGRKQWQLQHMGWMM
jgi:hypothetical protein